MAEEKKADKDTTMKELAHVGAKASVEQSWAHRRREAGDLAGKPEYEGNLSPANVQHALSGVAYPATKADLVREAEANGAHPDVVEVVRRLPRDEFGGPQDVMKAYGDLAEE